MSGSPSASMLRSMNSTTNDSTKTDDDKTTPIETSLMGTLGRPFV